MISIKDILVLDSNLPPHTQKTPPGPDAFTGEFYQAFKQEIIILHRLFHKIEEKGLYPKSFYETIITLIPKPKKDKKRKLQIPSLN